MRLGTYLMVLAGLVALQVLLLADMNLFRGILVPAIYPLFILLLPFVIGRVQLLFAGFGVGLLVDVLMGTGGVHAMASTFLAFVRPHLVELISPRGRDMGVAPRPGVQDASWFAGYLVFGFAAHHLVWVLVEYWSLAIVGKALLRWVVSTLVSAGLAGALLTAFKRTRR